MRLLKLLLLISCQTCIIIIYDYDYKIFKVDNNKDKFKYIKLEIT